MSSRVATLTFNPSLDVATSVASLTPDRKLRTDRPSREPGGGGVNVSRALANLGVGSDAIVVVGGATGELLTRLLASDRVDVQPVEVPSTTRESFSVTDRSSQRQYRFVLPGETLAADVVERSMDAIAALPAPPSLVVASGSLPPGLPDDAYATVVLSLREREIEVVLDTSGPALQAAVAVGGFCLLKPNIGELASLVGRELHGDDDVRSAARRLVDDGASRAVLVTLGAAGAMLVTDEINGALIHSPTVPVRSTVGAGDSTVAGMVAGLARGEEMMGAARRGVAAGAAAVMTEGSELCRGEDAEQLLAAMAG